MWKDHNDPGSGSGVHIARQETAVYMQLLGLSLTFDMLEAIIITKLNKRTFSTYVLMLQRDSLFTGNVFKKS